MVQTELAFTGQARLVKPGKLLSLGANRNGTLYWLELHHNLECHFWGAHGPSTHSIP